MAPCIDRDSAFDGSKNGKRGARKVTSMALVAISSFTLLTTILLSLNDIPTPEQSGILYALHNPIVINGNFSEKAATEGWSGNGTLGNPYVIQGYDIDASSADAILIGNSSVHFIIKDCYLHGGGNFSGIRLDNCANGTLTENICCNNYDGIGIRNSHGIIISNNSVNNSDISDQYGISLYGSNNNTVANNNCSDNDAGIFLAYYMAPCENNTVIGNNCSSNIYSGIYLSSANDNLLSNNTCLNNVAYGIILMGSSDNILNNNNCSSNDVFGMIFAVSNSNIVRDNTIDSNGYNGIKIVSNSNDNLIYNNTISNNTRYGITCEVDTANNGIWNNTFYHNNGTGDVYDSALIQAHDNGTSNWWNNTDGYGNWWSDWQNRDFDLDGFQDAPYNISGTAGAKDYFPLAKLPEYIPEFTEIIIPIASLMLIALAFGRIRRSSPPQPR